MKEAIQRLLSINIIAYFGGLLSRNILFCQSDDKSPAFQPGQRNTNDYKMKPTICNVVSIVIISYFR